MAYGVKNPRNYSHKTIPVIHPDSYDVCPGCFRDVIGPPSRGLAPVKFPEKPNESYEQTIHMVCQACYKAQARLNRGTIEEFRKARNSDIRGARPVVGVSELIQHRTTPVAQVHRAKPNSSQVQHLIKAAAGLMNMAHSFMAQARHIEGLIQGLAATQGGTSELCAIEEILMSQPPKTQQALFGASGPVGGADPQGPPGSNPFDDPPQHETCPQGLQEDPFVHKNHPQGLQEDPFVHEASPEEIQEDQFDDIDFGMTDEQRARMDAAVKKASERVSKVVVEIRHEEI